MSGNKDLIFNFTLSAFHSSNIIVISQISLSAHAIINVTVLVGRNSVINFYDLQEKGKIEVL